MLSIGVAELGVILLIVAMFAIPVVIAIVVILGKRNSQSSNAAAGLAQCRACGRPLSPVAQACPECGALRG
jgi:hypothetical protein